MRITKLEVLTLGTSWRNLLFVKLSTDEGLVGLGEARLSNRTETLPAYLEAIRPRFVLGTDPFETEKLVQTILSGDSGRVGEIVAMAASLLEVACWDLIGQALGVPVYRLLGGAVRDRIPAYASGWAPVERIPEGFAAAARRAVARGFRALKLDPFGTGHAELSRAELHEAIDLCEAVRAAVGPDVDLIIAMHGRFTPAAAIRIARSLERIEPGWLEEPVSSQDLQALQKVARQIRSPVAAGTRLHHRFEFRELLERQACDLIQPDLTHCCGLGEMKKLAAMAEAHSLWVALPSTAGPVATAANLHLAACVPNFKIQEHFADFAPDEILRGGRLVGLPGNLVKEVVTGCPEVVAGSFSLPHGPGLGVSLNEEILRAHPVQDHSLRLFRADWQQSPPMASPPRPSPPPS